MRSHLLSIALLCVSLSATLPAAFGAPKKPAAATSATGQVALRPEALSAKAFLEDLMVRRYSQKLSTVLDRTTFTLGAQLDLIEAPPQEFKSTQEELDTKPADLLLGTLDPEALLKNYAGADAAGAVRGFLENYRIKTVNLSVGIKDDVSATVKGDVEKWLAGQLKDEFGAAGKSSVSVIQTSEKKLAPKNFWDWLSQFQSLAGQMVLGLALLLGAMIWSTGAKKSKSDVAGELASAPSPAPAAPPVEAHSAQDNAVEEEARKHEIMQAENVRNAKEIRKLTKSIALLLPRIEKDLEGVLRSWCGAGEEGRLKVACFAEALGKDLGKLPIPVDAIGDLTKVFSRMAALASNEKRDALQKSYWDMLSVLNLGLEALNQPFSYLGSVKIDTLSTLLLEENPRMKTLVAFNMPDELRERYMATLTPEQKKELVETALRFDDLPVSEVRSLDNVFKNRINPGGKKDLISYKSSFTKLVASLSQMDQIRIVGNQSGELIESFKRSTASLAFLHQWSDEKLSILLGRTMPDELLAYLRTLPEMKDRFISLCPPMTAEMVIEEFERSDSMNDTDKNRHLASLLNRVQTMVDGKEILLEEAFANRESDDTQKAQSYEMSKAA